jgi:4-amino-4-deoxy-L-arabinose transferase-like glycosyltransferase
MWSLAGLTLVVALAVLYRTYALDRIPPGLFGDEAADGLVAADIRAGRSWPLFIEEPATIKWSSREPLYHYLTAGVFAVVAPSVWSLRLSSAVLGSATVLALALLARRLFGTRIGLIAAALLAVSRWHVTISRIGLRAIIEPLLLIVVVHAFVILLERRTRAAAAAFGLLLGLGFYSYPSYWIVPLALLLVLGVALRTGIPQPMTPLWVAAGLCALIVAAPLLGYAAAKPDYFFARAARTAGVTATPYGPPFLLDNAQRVLLMLHFRGDNNPRHNIPGAPQLDPITGALFVVGLFLVLRTSGLDLERRVGLLAFWLLPLVPSAVSDSAPHALRTLGAAPAVCVIAALGLDRLAGAAARRFASAGPAPIAVLLIAAGVLNWHAYFDQWAQRPELAAAFNTDAVRFFDMALDLATRDDVYASTTVDQSPQRRFLSLRGEGSWHRIDGAQVFTDSAPARDRVFICDTPALEVAVEELYPHAEVIAHFAHDGRHGSVYRVRRDRLRPTLDKQQQARIGALVGAGGSE